MQKLEKKGVAGGATYKSLKTKGSFCNDDCKRMREGTRLELGEGYTPAPIRIVFKTQWLLNLTVGSD
jgi:hypothetical protein